MEHEIYADHAATAPLDPAALEAMLPYLTQSYANPAALYRSGLQARRRVEQARHTVAQCLGCLPEQIFFTSGGSEGNTWAVFSGGRREGPGSREVLITPIEHPSVAKACQGLQPLGIGWKALPLDGSGRVVAQALENALQRRPRLVSVQYANNEVGILQDIPLIAGLCHSAQVPIHTDAVQAVGQIPVSLVDIDFLTASAHKFGGPKGVGFLYAREPSQLRPLIWGGSQQGGLRPGTEPVALIAGMAAALENACRTREARAAQKQRLAEAFCQTLLAGWPKARLHSTLGGLPGIVSVALPGWDAQGLTYRLDIAGVCVSPGAACSNDGRAQPSHVLLALGGQTAEDARCTLRFSFGSANRPEDGVEAARRLLHILQH